MRGSRWVSSKIKMEAEWRMEVDGGVRVRERRDRDEEGWRGPWSNFSITNIPQNPS